MAERQEEDEFRWLPKVGLTTILSTLLLIQLIVVSSERGSIKTATGYEFADLLNLFELATLNIAILKSWECLPSPHVVEQFWNNFKKLVFPPIMIIIFHYGVFLPCVTTFNKLVMWFLYGQDVPNYAGIAILNFWFYIWLYFIFLQ